MSDHAIVIIDESVFFLDILAVAIRKSFTDQSSSCACIQI